jgi:hypothetical protein
MLPQHSSQRSRPAVTTIDTLLIKTEVKAPETQSINRFPHEPQKKNGNTVLDPVQKRIIRCGYKKANEKIRKYRPGI